MMRAQVTLDSPPSSEPNPRATTEGKNGLKQLTYPLDVLIVGGGIGGLTLAKTLEMAGANVKVTERADMETIKLRAAGGPIQLASNALGVLRRIDPELFKKIQSMCTVTGLRRNGLKDGKTGDWYLEFDTKTPANKRQLPPTAVIDRPDLQQLLIDDLGGKVECGRLMTKYVNLPNGRVEAHYSDGSVETADLLIGADGIWSQVRAQMHDVDIKSATYSGFKVFAGIADYVPKDINDVGYKVFMGRAKYFVATDIGKGRVQWYAFIGQAPDAVTPEGEEALKWLENDIFGEWCEEVREIINITEASRVESRALFDRPPQVFRSWSDGNVALVGDAIHPMMPNLGQGGCMAIEDAFVLAEELSKLNDANDVSTALKNYRRRRQVRTAAVQGLSRFGAEMLLRFFDHPFRIEVDKAGGLPRFVNFGYYGLLMTAWKVLKVLDTAFKLQFSFLFEEP
eukprot:CAMPEP_0184478776 /NCGR_PEP_ID=MMETSP0113_2-20130426/705_1 /TAXON_ID=91329 /ORGANISM="Norrisiella sphaerica, Strain BC52" /LENGTH=453 /DNA_ID=CAMNT_0026856675 /DNA_START=398 /DNA_END=1759 /DNA_ORIENTATION=+